MLRLPLQKMITKTIDHDEHDVAGIGQTLRIDVP